MTDQERPLDPFEASVSRQMLDASARALRPFDPAAITDAAAASQPVRPIGAIRFIGPRPVSQLVWIVLVGLSFVALLGAAAFIGGSLPGDPLPRHDANVGPSANPLPLASSGRVLVTSTHATFEVPSGFRPMPPSTLDSATSGDLDALSFERPIPGDLGTSTLRIRSQPWPQERTLGTAVDDLRTLLKAQGIESTNATEDIEIDGVPAVLLQYRFSAPDGDHHDLYLVAVRGGRAYQVHLSNPYRRVAGGYEADQRASVARSVMETIRSTLVFTGPAPSSEAASPWPSGYGKLRMPYTVASPAGTYGFEGGPGTQAGMHRVIGYGAGTQETAVLFSVGPDCLSTSPGATQSGNVPAVPVRVAGFDGRLIEHYEPPVTFGSLDGDETTRAYELAVGDLTLCAWVTWHATTTDEELAAAMRILDTLRVEPIGDGLIRVLFTLEAGWDTG